MLTDVFSKVLHPYSDAFGVHNAFGFDCTDEMVICRSVSVNDAVAGKLRNPLDDSRHGADEATFEPDHRPDRFWTRLDVRTHLILVAGVYRVNQGDIQTR
ncbi:hypothetical protein EL23_08945 [Paenibacillus polymyxa]|nr:hypothetical protein EL23_08945 [Paenibacillus polymyxa]